MTHVHVEVERNIRSAVGEINKVSFGKLDEKAEPKKVLPFRSFCLENKKIKKIKKVLDAVMVL